MEKPELADDLEALRRVISGIMDALCVLFAANICPEKPEKQPFAENKGLLKAHLEAFRRDALIEAQLLEACPGIPQTDLTNAWNFFIISAD